MIGFYGIGYFMAHLFKTMGKTWEENPAYVLTAGVFGMIVVISCLVILEQYNNIIITLCFLVGFIFRFIRK
jgi:uncharacterized membrane protein YdcZ (DUF606 family)